MRIDLLKCISRRFELTSVIQLWLLAAYIALSFCLFFRWVQPSLEGRVDRHIAADSTTYLYFADSIREGRADPLVAAALDSFPNTLWSPVLMALVLKSTLAMVVANYAMFFLALALLRSSFTFSMGWFITLLLLNATTTISLISVNKEMIDLLILSIFLFAYRRRRYLLILLALLMALFSRYEVCLVMMVFLIFVSRLNPLRKSRLTTLIALIVAMSLVLPMISGSLEYRFQEASTAGLVAYLDILEMHYMFAFAVVPKIAENLFGMLINPSTLSKLADTSDIANSYILLFNNLASALVVAMLIKTRSASLRSDIIFLAMIGTIVMAVALVIQPRYFYFVYVLLCLRLAQALERSEAERGPVHVRKQRVTGVPALGREDTA